MPAIIQQSAGKVKLGVTKTDLVPCCLVTGAAELPRETSKEPAVIEQPVAKGALALAEIGPLQLE